MTVTYNPLTALGIRIGSPAQDSFLDEHVPMLTNTFGAAFVADLTHALVGDLPAAWRIADTLAPAATFQVGRQEGDAITVTYSHKGEQGHVRMSAIAPVVLSQAMVLVTTAIAVHDKDRRSPVRLTRLPPGTARGLERETVGDLIYRQHGDGPGRRKACKDQR